MQDILILNLQLLQKRKKNIQKHNSIITIKPDKNVKYGQLSDIMKAVGVSGANKIVLVSRYRKQ